MPDRPPECGRGRPARADRSSAFRETDWPGTGLHERDARAHRFILRCGCQHLANSPDLVALWFRQCQEFEAVAKSIAISHQSPKFYGIRRHRQHQFHGHDFPGIKRAGQSRSDAILSQFV